MMTIFFEISGVAISGGVDSIPEDCIANGGLPSVRLTCNRGETASVAPYFAGTVTFGAAVNGSIPNFGYASLG